MWYKSKYLHLNNSFYYNTEVLTRPGAKGCNYGHSTRQETGLSVLPVDVTKHTRMLKTGHHVPYTQHHYDLSFTERLKSYNMHQRESRRINERSFNIKSKSFTVTERIIVTSASAYPQASHAEVKQPWLQGSDHKKNDTNTWLSLCMVLPL